jgi:alanine racemase
LGEDLLHEPLTWAEIDLAAYRHNIAELRRITRPEARFMAVVKANGYGHGAALAWLAFTRRSSYVTPGSSRRF